MVKTGNCGKVMRVAPFRVCHFLLEKGGIMVWSPDAIPVWWHQSYLLCDCCFVIEGPQIKVANDREVAYSCSSYLVRGNPALCWQRAVVSRDVPPEAYPCGSRKFLRLTICWKSNSQYEPCTVLVVEPAIYLWWSPLFRW